MADQFAEHVRDMGDAYDDGDWSYVLRRAGFDRGPKRRTWWVAVVTLVCLFAAAVPAIALSGTLGSLFGFSSSGSAVDEATVDLRDASALESSGAAGTVRLISTREGVAFYVAHSKEGGFCPFTGPADQARPSFWQFGCMNAAAADYFPSPAHPVLDLSPSYTSSPKTGIVWITQLRGFAADGVKTIEVLDSNGAVLAKVPVTDNVYAGPLMSHTPGQGGIGPAKTMVGLDENGSQVWTNTIFPDRPR
jgi:hypothetical protein